jgi:heme/copper-type cytochrome/quinol oxidase subunit 2
VRLTVLSLAFAAIATPALGLASPPSYRLEIRQHGFVPGTLTVPAGTRVKLLVKNTRTLPSEFESFDLNREKVVPPGAAITVWIGPLSAGKYKFFDDFNPGVTGSITASKPPGGGAP